MTNPMRTGSFKPPEHLGDAVLFNRSESVHWVPG